MTIGEVLDQLRPEFPDVTISKIRFLESERLVEPVRAPSGYRHFTPEHVSRLRYVLTAQRDHYLPLRVIREHLDAMDRGLQPPSPLGRPGVPMSVVPDDAPPPEAFRREATDLRLSRVELAEAAGTDPDLVDRLDEYGLIVARAGHYDADALAVAQAARELAAFGLEPRHLRSFRTAADREVGLVEQVVTPLLRQRSDDARDRAAEAARELAAVAVRLHTALVRAGVRRALGNR
jgi:DNA-binding transcriptional MerR regulator